MLDRVRRLEEAKARAEWSRVVLHGIRQRLGTMLTEASAVDAVDPSSRLVKRVRGGVMRANRLLGDVLDPTVLDVASVPLGRGLTDIAKLACGVADETPRAHVAIHGDIGLLEIDPDRIRQVLSNLVANAAKYRHDGSEISIVVARLADQVVVSVTNEGEEIPKRERSRIFDRYYRSNRTHDRAASGYGIGLHVCRGLVEAHGGRMSVHSSKGMTTFSFGLPVRTQRSH